MDPRAALEAGNYAAYNAWRANGGFAARAHLPASMAYTLTQPGSGYATVCTDITVDRVYRGHRCMMARCERLGGQGFVNLPLADVL